jgi:pyridoxine 5-phosphate synthase
MVELGVNIDHVATLRQARRAAEPDPVWAAAEAELGGADTITVHLREDRRHINDRDVELLRKSVQCKLNLEMSVNADILKIAVKTRPAQATLVPERREELTTEGGLDLTREPARIKQTVSALKEAGILVSAFIDPESIQVALAADYGFNAVELHTGEYANASGRSAKRELERIAAASAAIVQSGLRLHAGHGLNYRNVIEIAQIHDMAEVNIGHSIVSRAVFVGIRDAVRQMKDVLNTALAIGPGAKD